jgi:signal transduction histidine kinase/CheY-like chemotaxis protein
MSTAFGSSVGVEEAILHIDWSTTPLGIPSGWPHSLKSILDLILSSGKPMFIVWGSSRSLLYNDAYSALLGQKHPRALGAAFFSVWPDLANEVGPQFDRLFGGAAVELDDISISFDREDESPDKNFVLSYTPIRDAGNRVSGVLCIHSEKGNTVPTPPLQSRDHKRLVQMFEQAPSFIAVLQGPEHRIELANAGFLKIVGDRRIIGVPFAQALPEAVAQGYLKLLDDAFARGQQIAGTGARYANRSAIDSDESERFLDFVFQPITDAIGQVTGIFVYGADVTERVIGERALRDREIHLHQENADLGRLVTERSAQLEAKEALIQTVYEHSSEYHVVVVEVESDVFRVEELNPAALSLSNATRSQVIGRTLDECLLPGEASIVNAQLTACLASEGPYHCEFEYAGQVIEGTASPLPQVRGIGRQVAISARNVTERRSLEEQLRQSQKMEAVGQLTGGLAHDFNNLLTAILGSLELLQKRLTLSESHDVARYLDTARAAAQRAASLTHRLLAFARRQTLDAKSTDVNHLVAGMNELIQRTVGPAVTLLTELAPDLWNAWVDPNQLENALLNLCLNARDAMSNGGTLSISTVNHEFPSSRANEYDLAPGQYLSLSVSDTGTGMSPAIIAKAFEPFFTTKAVGEGTGLGLSMIYGFARQSGGHIHIDSEIDQGTTVCLYLPRHAGGTPSADRARAAVVPVLSGGGKTVLVVDDEAAVRMLVVEVLSDLGYAVIEAPDGVEGMNILQSDQPVDLLITDIGLPGGIDGIELSAAARASRLDIKILWITGYAENMARARGNGEADVPTLKKPFALQELADCVSTIMRRGEEI